MHKPNDSENNNPMADLFADEYYGRRTQQYARPDLFNLSGSSSSSNYSPSGVGLSGPNAVSGAGPNFGSVGTSLGVGLAANLGSQYGGSAGGSLAGMGARAALTGELPSFGQVASSVAGYAVRGALGTVPGALASMATGAVISGKAPTAGAVGALFGGLLGAAAGPLGVLLGSILGEKVMSFFSGAATTMTDAQVDAALRSEDFNGPATPNTSPTEADVAGFSGGFDFGGPTGPGPANTDPGTGLSEGPSGPSGPSDSTDSSE